MSRPTRILFVRHGQAHNPKRVIYGRLPRIALSRAGREQVERTARYLASFPLAAIYTSPMLRARQTAARIAAAHPGVAPRRCAWLTEVRTSWQGEPSKLADQPGFSYYGPVRAEGDERILDVFRRMDRALRMALRRHPETTTVCVSHGDPIKILWLGRSGKELTPSNVCGPEPEEASIVAFEFDDPGALPRVSYVNPATSSP